MYKYHLKSKKTKVKNTGRRIAVVQPVYLFSLLLAVAVVYLGIQMSGAGAKLANLMAREESLLKENKKVSQEISDQLSLTALNVKVTELAFEKPQRLFYLPGNQGYVSLK